MPNEEEYGAVSLGTIGHGVAKELFERELNEVLKNIVDPNTDAKAARKIILTVTLIPNESREDAAIRIQAVSRLAGVKPYGSSLFFIKKNGKPMAVQHNLKQQSFLDSKNNVVPFETGEKDA